MPRQQGIDVQNKFIKGFITEATALQFPADACTEIENCVIDNNGKITRRLGVDNEVDWELLPVPRAAAGEAITKHMWNAVSGNGSINFLVLQKGNLLYFFDVSSSTTISPNVHATTIDLDTFLTDVSNPTEMISAQFASGNGHLFVTHPYCDPFYVSYNPTTTAITGTKITLLKRDTEGLDDGLADRTRPTYSYVGIQTGNPAHLYNIFNQGWFNLNALAQWDGVRTDMPSNTDILANSRKAPDDSFDAATLDAKERESTRAPRGHFILDAFLPDRSAAVVAESLPALTLTETEVYERPSSVAFLSSRVFYAGVQNAQYSGNIYFSQIIEDPRQYGFCYQSLDPTSEESSLLLASDGGVIKILDIATITRLVSYQGALIVFATNGVWLISGSAGAAFKADDYTVKKLSSVGTSSFDSFVDVKGVPLWWAEDGIYTIKYDANYGSFALESLTDTTILSFFRDIPLLNKKYVKGTYDLANKKIYWVYNSSSNLTADHYFEYDRVLILNTATGAFYKWSLFNNTQRMFKEIFYIKTADNSTQPVVKYLLCYNTTPTTDIIFFMEMTNTSYTDFVLFDDYYGSLTTDFTEDYTSSFSTGYKIDGQTQKFFQSNYVFVFLDQETNASCYMRGAFDFATDGSNGKYSSSQQIYNSTLTSTLVNYRRLKVRGKGRSLQLKFTSESGKPFTILGWSIKESVNADV